MTGKSNSLESDEAIAGFIADLIVVACATCGQECDNDRAAEITRTTLSIYNDADAHRFSELVRDAQIAPGLSTSIMLMRSAETRHAELVGPAS